jgi:hypothetical protein
MSEANKLCLKVTVFVCSFVPEQRQRELSAVSLQLSVELSCRWKDANNVI